MLRNGKRHPLQIYVCAYPTIRTGTQLRGVRQIMGGRNSPRTPLYALSSQMIINTQLVISCCGNAPDWGGPTRFPCLQICHFDSELSSDRPHVSPCKTLFCERAWLAIVKLLSACIATNLLALNYSFLSFQSC